MSGRLDDILDPSVEAAVLMQLQDRMDRMLTALAALADDVDRLREATESPRVRVPEHGPDGRIVRVEERIDPVARLHKPRAARPRRIETAPVLDVNPITDALAPLAVLHTDLTNMREAMVRVENAVKTAPAPPGNDEIVDLLGQVAKVLTAQSRQIGDLRAAIEAPRERVPVRDKDGRIVAVDDRIVTRRRR